MTMEKILGTNYKTNTCLQINFIILFSMKTRTFYSIHSVSATVINLMPLPYLGILLLFVIMFKKVVKV